MVPAQYVLYSDMRGPATCGGPHEVCAYAILYTVCECSATAAPGKTVGPHGWMARIGSRLQGRALDTSSVARPYRARCCSGVYRRHAGWKAHVA